MKTSRLLLLVFVAMLQHQGVMAYDFMADGLCYNINSDSISVTVTYKTQYSSWIGGDITIPKTVIYNGTNYSVTSIGNSAFHGCSITSVTIPNSVTFIDSRAFELNISLTSVSIPNSVITINQYAFYGCSSLASVTIPKSITFIDDYAFQDCSGLKHLFWNAKNCSSNGNMTTSNLETIIIGEQVERLPSNLAKGSKITSVTIPSSVTTIGYQAFAFCNGLASVTIPNSVTFIGSFAFYGCSSLTSVVIPNSVSSIGNQAFNNCSKLTKAIIGENVTSIGQKAFAACPNMKDLIALRERPITIPTDTFYGTATSSCDLHVRTGSKVRYEAQDVWKDFLFIFEDAEDYVNIQSGDNNSSGIKGDVNGDGQVDISDVNSVINIMLGKE